MNNVSLIELGKVSEKTKGAGPDEFELDSSGVPIECKDGVDCLE